MGKIHILTFHNALNYGAVLQCYALYSTINKFKNCDVLNYDGRIKTNRTNTKVLIKSLLLASRERKKRLNFDDFIKKNIVLSDKFETYKDLCEYQWDIEDEFCVGSDQVWNWDFVGTGEAYFLSFVPENLNKFSYAASVGRELVPEHINRMKNYLSTFSGISVRETTTCDTLNRNGIICRQNVDPVFLLSQEQWKKISMPVNNEDTPYVLIYLLQKAPNLLQAAEAYAKKEGIRVVFISTGLKREVEGEYVVHCGPDEFIRYFLKADAVFTNSFHGVSFSILFNKPFFFEFLQNGTKTNNRLRDITEMFQLQEQNIAINKMGKCDIDYEIINSAISSKREEAIFYLSSCIKGEEDRISSEKIIKHL